MMGRWPLILLLVALADPARAQFVDGLAAGGGVEVYVGAQLAADPDLLAARTRAELGLTFPYDRSRIVARTRLTHDALSDELRVDLREVFVDVFLGPFDLRTGHQIIAWGRADGVLVTDLLAPLDLSEFVAQPVEDLRLPLLAARASLFVGRAEITAVLVPRHPVARLPQVGSPWFPAPDEVLGIPVELRDPAHADDHSLGRAETALRLTWRGVPRSDVSLLWVNGFNRLPALRRDLGLGAEAFDVVLAVTPVYDRRQVFGAQVETAAVDPFVVRGEVAFHTRALLAQPIIIPQTPAGLLEPAFLEGLARGFLVARPYAEAVVGLERRIAVHSLGVQLVGRWVIDHDERVAADAFEPAVSVLWLGRFLRDTMVIRLFGIYDIGRDYWINPDLTYSVQDGLNLSVGAHLFGGAGPDRGDPVALLREPARRYSLFRENTFAYARLSYRF